MLDLMSCCRCLEILNYFLTRGPAFSFCNCPHKFRNDSASLYSGALCVSNHGILGNPLRQAPRVLKVMKLSPKRSKVITISVVTIQAVMY